MRHATQSLPLRENEFPPRGEQNSAQRQTVNKPPSLARAGNLRAALDSVHWVRPPAGRLPSVSEL